MGEFTFVLGLGLLPANLDCLVNLSDDRVVSSPVIRVFEINPPDRKLRNVVPKVLQNAGAL